MATPLELLSQQIKQKLSDTASRLFTPVQKFVQSNPTPAGFISKQLQPQINQVQNTFKPATSFIQRNPLPAGYAVKKFQETTKPIVLGMTKFQAPLEEAATKLPPVIQNSFPITQVPGQIGETVRQTGRLLSLQPKPLDVATVFGPMAVGKVAALRGVKEGQVNQAVNLLKNKLNRQDIDLIGRVAETIESKGPKINLGDDGKTYAALAENVFGKEAKTWTNQKIKNAFDLVLGKIGQEANTAGLGLSVKNIRGDVTKGRLYDVNGKKVSTGLMGEVTIPDLTKKSSDELLALRNKSKHFTIIDAIDNELKNRGYYQNKAVQDMIPQFEKISNEELQKAKLVFQNNPDLFKTQLEAIKQIEIKRNIADRNKVNILESSRNNNITTKSNVAQPPVSDVRQQIGGTGYIPKGKILPTSEVVQSPKMAELPPSGNIPPQDPVQVIMDAIKAAKPIRGAQENIYGKIRSQQAGAIAGIGKNIPGEAGFHAQLGQLKGEMPKVEFEGIRKQVTQPVIDTLFNRVEQSILSPFEKITAKSGLSKLLAGEGGSVPNNSELKLLSDIFPPEFIQTVLDKRSAFQKLFALGENALNLPRALMATADLSAPLRQGVFLVGRPKQWIPAFGSMFKYFANEKSYQGLNESIKAMPTYNLMRESKLAFSDMSPILQSREEAFMSNLPEKLPGFGKLARASNRAYSGFLNKLRADTFNDLVKNASNLGLDVKQIAPSIANFVNTATGRGSYRGMLKPLNQATVILNGAFFSPRLMASRLNLLDPTYYMSLDPFVRKEALKSLFTFAATGLSVLGLAKLGGLNVGTDPRSADFGKIRLGNTRYDPWGGFQQYIVLASRLLTGQMVNSSTGKEFNLGEGYKPTTRMDIIQRFFESKTSPVASFVLGLLKGQTTMGEKLNIPVEIMDRLIPMMAQDMYDLYRQDGPDGIFKQLPGVFGVGVQTYTDQIPMQGTTAGGKPNVQWRQQPGLGENIINTITGTKVSNIPVEQWQQLRDIKQLKADKKMQLDQIKKKVLETGQSQVVDGKVIQLKNGIVTESNPGQKEPTLIERLMGVKKVGAVEETPSNSALTKEQEKFKVDIAKAQVQQSGQSQIVGNTYVYPYKDTTKTIDLSFQPTKPTLTGQVELDKKLKSEYSGEITQKINDIVELYKQKQLTADQANTLIAQLKQQQSSTGVTGVRKPSYPKAPKLPKFKQVKAKATKKTKLPKLKTIKPVKQKKVKQLKSKMINIKLLKVKGR